jgi:hypothetical protein
LNLRACERAGGKAFCAQAAHPLPQLQLQQALGFDLLAERSQLRLKPGQLLLRSA